MEGKEIVEGEEKSIQYTHVSEDVVIYRTDSSREADEVEDLLKENQIEYRVLYRPTYPGRPFLQAYLSKPLLIAKVGSFKGVSKIKEFLEIEQRRRNLSCK